MKSVGKCLLLLSLMTIPARAADLIEPWPVGLSNFELAVAAPYDGVPSASSVVGFGLHERLSLGFVFDASADERTGTRMLLLYTHPLGTNSVVDAWCEADLTEVGTDPACGLEWSAAVDRWVPYARVTIARSEDSTAAVPLLGMMLPLSRRLQLHLEVSSEDADAGERPLRLALGPNWALSSRFELVPELSWARQGDGEDAFELGLGVVVDVSR